MNFTKDYLQSVTKQFTYYKQLGDKTFEQLSEEDINWKCDEESNSIAIIIRHIVGNMLSRWSEFLNTDGEKEWRDRENEFADVDLSRDELIAYWEKGWACLFDAISSINENNFNALIYIRNEGHTITEALNRQLAHYPYHIGQLVFIGKMCKGKAWESLSIPKGNSAVYNEQKFSEEKRKVNFIDDLLEKRP